MADKLALTARHVTDDFLTLDTRVDPVRRPTGEFDPFYAVTILSVNLLGDASRPVQWEMANYCRSDHTDISVLSVSPGDDLARTMQHAGLTYFDWHLRPPPIGSTVQLFGYPLPEADQAGTAIKFQGQLEVKTGHVTEVHDVLHSHGYLEFPCYRIDVAVDHSFSGGPVIWNGALAGIVSAGPSFDNGAWVASLWPVAVMPYSDKSRGIEDSNLFDAGRVNALDWHEVRDHIELANCDTDGCNRLHLKLNI